MTRALATCTIADSGTCVESSFATDRCLLATVSNTPAGVRDGAAASVANLTAHLKVTEPLGVYAGTVVFLVGAGGSQGFWEEVFPNSIGGTLQSALDLNYRVIQVRWNTPWVSGTAGTLALAARPASLLKAIHDDTSLYTSGKPFIVVGHSAGGSAVAYTLCHYGGGDWIDCVIFTCGPPHTRLDYNSAGTNDPTWASIGPALCTTGSVIELSTSEDTIIDASFGPRSYSSAKSMSGGVDNPGYSNSILRADAELSYPDTTITFVIGDGDGTVATPSGRHYKNNIRSAVSEFVTTGTQGHDDVPNSTSGMGFIDDALAAATFNH